MATFLTYKRWRLRDGVDMQAVIDMVRDRIVPHYEALDRTVRLGLEHIDGSRAVLATQRWLDRERRDRTIGGATFQPWLDAYRPLLEDWDRLVEFEAEWESSELI
ncbi:MAG: hypothetical protein M3Y35_19110 [Actinomycetota bacterium]|nr:hypothetical protein [Actinomycetota bacterium]